jgi:antibiotic biosynthesis monooxygenase (ABM) superfamily enzyme
MLNKIRLSGVHPNKSEQPMNTQPPKWKFALVVWLAIYPTITIIFATAGPYLLQIPLLLRTLILTGVLVPFMVYLALPFLMKRLSGWLNKE